METNIEQIITGRLLEIYKPLGLTTDDIRTEGKMSGGMTNNMYKVTIKGVPCVYRQPGTNSSKFVDRENELAGTLFMNSVVLAPRVDYFDPKTGEKVMEFVPGCSLNKFGPIEGEPIEMVANALSHIHSACSKDISDYDPFGRLETYEGYNKDLGFIFPGLYNECKGYLLGYKDYLESQEKVACHGDCQPSNFIYDMLFHRLYVIDFEYVGKCDPVYDIAQFCNSRFEDGERLLEVYFRKLYIVHPEIKGDVTRRFYLWRMFQCLQWFNVAMFQHLHGGDSELTLDFNGIAMFYLNEFIRINNLLKHEGES